MDGNRLTDDRAGGLSLYIYLLFYYIEAIIKKGGN